MVRRHLHGSQAHGRAPVLKCLPRHTCCDGYPPALASPAGLLQYQNLVTVNLAVCGKERASGWRLGAGGRMPDL
jgi:hypothetical protein